MHAGGKAASLEKDDAEVEMAPRSVTVHTPKK